MDRGNFARGAVVLAALATVAGASPVAGQSAPDGPQRVTYHIEALLDEARDVLRGRARFTYENRSGVTLERLYFHQHLNAFRPNSAWARAERRERARKYLELVNLSGFGKKFPWQMSGGMQTGAAA